MPIPHAALPLVLSLDCARGALADLDSDHQAIAAVCLNELLAAVTYVAAALLSADDAAHNTDTFACLVSHFDRHDPPTRPPPR